MANANSTIEIELEIKQALDQLNKLQDELKNSSKGFSQAGKSAQRFERVIKSAMSGVATAMKKSLSIITSFRTALVGLVGVYSASEFVQFGANFEREISKLNALTKATETEQLRLRKAIREVGSSTAFTATQAAAAANVLAALGRTSNQISQELGVVVRVAGATSTAIETVSEAIAAQMNVFGESAEQVGNVFAAAYSTSAANVEKLQIALGQVGPVAKSAGLTLTETAGAIAFLIDRGFRAEAAGTALRGTLVRLINPSKAVLEEFQSLGVSFEEIQKLGFQDQMQVLAARLGNVASQAEKNRILTKIFGVEALAAANNLITAFQSGNRVIDNQAEKLRQATDAAGLYKQITSDLRGAIDELISAVQDKLLTAFQAAEPFVKEIVTQLKDAVNSLTTGQIIDAVENIGVTLVKGAFGFYDLIRVAINAVYEFLNSPAFQQVIQIAKDSLASLGFTSLDDQIAVAEQEVLKQAVLIRELEISKDSPFSIDFLTDQTIGAVQEQLDAAKAVLANLKAQKAEQESALFLIKDRAELEERLIGKIREGAQLIRERAQAQAQLGDVQESSTNQIASSASTTVPALNDISEQLENVKQAGEAAFGILTQQIKDIYSVAFDDDLPILDRVNQIDAFVKSIESSLPQLAGVLEPGQFQAVQTILVDLLNVSDALDKIAQSQAAEAFEKMGREIKKLDPKQQADFERDLQAQFDLYGQIEEQVSQINERGIERSEVEQINYDYANEIAKVKADQNLTIEQEIKLVNALEDAQQRELDNQEKKLTALDKINDSLQTQLGLSEGAAAAVISGVSGAGPNASRAANIAQSKSPEEAAAKLILSNEKVAAAIDESFELLFDTIDPLIDLLGDLISAINRLIGALIENATNAAEDLLDTVGLGPNGYIFGGGLARDLEDAFGFGPGSSRDRGPSSMQLAFAEADKVFEAIEQEQSTLEKLQPKIDELAALLDSLSLSEIIERFTEQTQQAIEPLQAEIEKYELALTQTGPMGGANYFAEFYEEQIQIATDKIEEVNEKTSIVISGLISEFLSDPLATLDDLTQSAEDQIAAIEFQNLSAEEQIQFRYDEAIATIEQQRALADLINNEELRNQLLDSVNQATEAQNNLLQKQQEELQKLNEEREREAALMLQQQGQSEIDKIISNLERTFENIFELVQSLRDQATGLLFGSSSTLTNQQKFQLAASEYQELLAAALDPEATEENVKDFQDFVDTYLQSAADVFKSSSQYQNIFNSVLADIEEVADFVSIAMPANEIERVKDQLVEIAEEFGVGIEEVINGLDQLTFALAYSALVASVPVKTVIDETNSDLVIEAVVTAVADQELSDTQIEAIVTAAEASGSDTVIEAVVTAVADKQLSQTEIQAIVTAIAAAGSDTEIDAVVTAIMSTQSDTQIEAVISAIAKNTPVVSALVDAIAANIPVISARIEIETDDIDNTIDRLGSVLQSSVNTFVTFLNQSTATVEGETLSTLQAFSQGGSALSGVTYLSYSNREIAAVKDLSASPKDLAFSYLEKGKPDNPYAIFLRYKDLTNQLWTFADLNYANSIFDSFTTGSLSANYSNVQKIGFRQGGLVPDPMDTIPAMLSPGEYILSPETVRRYGVSNLNRLNSGDTAALNATSDPEVKRLLAELIVAVRENDTEVNVYTDMEGQTKASIEEFRSELRERTRRQGDQYVPARYI